MANKVESYYTPVGKVKFPKTKVNDKEFGFLMHPAGLSEGDVYACKFSLILDPKLPEVKKLLEMLDEQEKPIKGKNFKAYKADKERKDEESEEFVENGLIAIAFTTSYPITIVDSKKKVCNDIKIGWNSSVAVKFTTKPVNNQGKIGLGRYVRAIQVVDLSETGQDLSGFGESEGYQSAGQQENPWEE